MLVNSASHSRWLAKPGDVTSLRFCFAFFGLDERYRDFSPIGHACSKIFAVDRNGKRRSTCVAVGVLLLLMANVEAQTTVKPQAHAGIVGTVLDEQAHPLKNISVHVVSEKTGMYMPTADSNGAGHFVIENLEPGTYSIFGESNAAAYPNTALSFYPNENPIKVTLGNFGEANVVLVLGPRAGVLCGTVLDKTTGQAIISQHALHFIARKVSNRADSVEFVGPAKFRWLIPPATEVTLELVAEGYKPWVYAETSSPLTPKPLLLESGEEKILNIRLEPQARQENHPE
jgi:hypothetical protein